MPYTFSAASLAHVLVDVSARRSGSAIDPTADTVQAAFLTSSPDVVAPVSGDWKTASWETNTTTDPDQYTACCLVGTGGAVALTAGTYYMWVRVVDSPETPVMYSGIVKVTP